MCDFECVDRGLGARAERALVVRELDDRDGCASRAAGRRTVDGDVLDGLAHRGSVPPLAALALALASAARPGGVAGLVDAIGAPRDRARVHVLGPHAGCDQRAGGREALVDHRAELLGGLRAHDVATVDEERRRSTDVQTGGERLGPAQCLERRSRAIGLEATDVESEVPYRDRKRAVVERAGEESGSHRVVGSLRRRCERRDRRRTRSLVHRERLLRDDEANVVSVGPAKLGERGLGAAAVRTLVVGERDDRDEGPRVAGRGKALHGNAIHLRDGEPCGQLGGVRGGRRGGGGGWVARGVGTARRRECESRESKKDVAHDGPLLCGAKPRR